MQVYHFFAGMAFVIAQNNALCDIDDKWMTQRSTPAAGSSFMGIPFLS